MSASHNFHIHSSVNEYPRLLPCLATVNSAAMSTGVLVSFSFMVSSGYMPSSGIAGLYGSFVPCFLRNLFSLVAASICIPTNSVGGFPFLHRVKSERER